MNNLVGLLLGFLSVILWNLMVFLVDYLDIIQFNFYENKGMMIAVILIIPFVLFSLLLKLMKKSKEFMIQFLSVFVILSFIFMIVGNLGL